MPFAPFLVHLSPVFHGLHRRQWRTTSGEQPAFVNDAGALHPQTMSKGFNYSKWDKLELSDDEDSHPGAKFVEEQTLRYKAVVHRRPHAPSVRCPRARLTLGLQ